MGGTGTIHGECSASFVNRVEGAERSQPESLQATSGSDHGAAAVERIVMHAAAPLMLHEGLASRGRMSAAGSGCITSSMTGSGVVCDAGVGVVILGVLAACARH